MQKSEHGPEQIEQQPDSQLSAPAFFFASLADAGRTLFSDRVAYAQDLRAQGEHLRAVHCLSDSKDIEAPHALNEIASDVTVSTSVRSSALSALGRVAERSTAAAPAALGHLADWALTGDPRDPALMAAIILGTVLPKISTTEVHEGIAARVIESCCAQVVQDDGVTRWEIVADPRDDGRTYPRLQSFCHIAGGLRDITSADVLADLLRSSTNGMEQHEILVAVENRPHDENLAMALRETKARGDSDQAVQLVPGLSASSGRILGRYESR